MADIHTLNGFLSMVASDCVNGTEYVGSDVVVPDHRRTTPEFVVSVEGDDMLPRMTFTDRDALCITLYALACQWRYQSANDPRRSRSTDSRGASVTWEVMFELGKAAHDQQGMDVAAITGISSLVY